MATALLVTITALRHNADGAIEPISVTSQTMTFVDIKPAEQALEAIKAAHTEAWYEVIGVIMKNVVI